ncbi:MAG: MarR family transcriptional regulator [candidate division KSB1 bacterium]|nr:MarR family transcriptional regulator [candidate division KSB1 bacterium]MDZ7313785.1 MarR family transcriptional regulator [candidate division KSB1 bacterium]
MPEKTLQQQAEKLNRLTKDLLRKFQMRDRNEIVCCGVSVSQCYALSLLDEWGEMSMVQLARKMFLDKSTMTRVVDGLIERELAVRRFEENDRRLIYVTLTAAGRALLAQIRAMQIAGLRQILERIPANKRQPLLDGLELFSNAVQDWLVTCCVPGKKATKIKSNKEK